MFNNVLACISPNYDGKDSSDAGRCWILEAANWPEDNESLVKRGEMYLTSPFSGVQDKDLGINRGMIEPSRIKRNLSK